MSLTVYHWVIKWYPFRGNEVLSAAAVVQTYRGYIEFFSLLNKINIKIFLASRPIWKTLIISGLALRDLLHQLRYI